MDGANCVEDDLGIESHRTYWRGAWGFLFIWGPITRLRDIRHGHFSIPPRTRPLMIKHGRGRLGLEQLKSSSPPI